MLVLCPNLATAEQLSEIALDAEGVWRADDAVIILRTAAAFNEWHLSGGRCILKLWWN